MSSEIYDLTLPAHDPNFPKPRGLLPVPPQVKEGVAREQARLQPYFTDEYAKRAIDDMTLNWYYEGTDVACRETPEGIEVLAVGWDEIGQILKDIPPEQRQDIKIRQP
jgi:hypothetical protein